MDSLNILTVPISKLYLSHEFEWQCQEMGFGKLEDILVLDPSELIAKEGFSYHWLTELSDLLMKHDLLHLLQTTPGRNFG